MERFVVKMWVTILNLLAIVASHMHICHLLSVRFSVYVRTEMGSAMGSRALIHIITHREGEIVRERDTIYICRYNIDVDTVCKYICIYIYVYVYIYSIYSNIYTYIYIYIYIHIYLRIVLSWHELVVLHPTLCAG